MWKTTTVDEKLLTLLLLTKRSKSKDELEAASHTMQLIALVLQASISFDIKQLYTDILSALSSDPLAFIHLSTSEPFTSHWSVNSNSFLHLDNYIYIPNSNNLHLCILHYEYDHPLSGHFRQDWTLDLVCCKCTWPGVWTYIRVHLLMYHLCTHKGSKA